MSIIYQECGLLGFIGHMSKNHCMVFICFIKMKPILKKLQYWSTRALYGF
jgi:hypothetical protein